MRSHVEERSPARRSEIVLVAFNARYSHTSLSLRCLRANLGSLHEQSEMVEFDLRISPQAAAEALLARDPKIILFSVYLWNLTITSETAAIIKRVRPEIRMVIGGPEVSFSETEDSVPAADHRICGEGEGVIEPACRALLAGDPLPPVIEAEAPDLNRIALPYGEYTDEDIAHRRIYVERSRGCPFACDYCLSAVESTVRYFPSEPLFEAWRTLIDRGARVFKFLDRSFNADPLRAAVVLRFFLENRRNGMMLHLEWEPDTLAEDLAALLASAPPRFFQIEAGVQTFNPEISARIRRRLNPERVETHLRTLASMPSVHLHADLLAGLPGEDLRSLAAGFDRLHACSPHEIQLGILKKLHGAPIARHDHAWQMVYNPSPPYEVLQTSALSFGELQQIRRFARFWDLTVNNGRFPLSAPLIWEGRPSVFDAFLHWSEWLYRQTGSTAGIAPPRLARLLSDYLAGPGGMDPARVREAINADVVAPTRTARGIERQQRRAQSK